MKRSKVKSSVINSFGYDKDHKILEVEFADTHAVYQYLHVPKKEFEILVALSKSPNESVGRYFNSTFKEKYSYKKV